MIYFDRFLPRIIYLSLSSTNRQTKVNACELLHAIVIYMIGKSVSEPLNSTLAQYQLYKLYNHIYPALFKLALGPEIRVKTPYIDKEEFINYSLKVSKLRMSKIGFSDTTYLYNLQEGICEYCNKPLLCNDDLSNTEVHHIKPINIGRERLQEVPCHLAPHRRHGIRAGKSLAAPSSCSGS